MPYLSINLDDASMTRLKREATKANMSLSCYAREKLLPKSSQEGIWPEGWFDLYGCWADLSVEEPKDEPFISGKLDWQILENYS